VARSALRTYGRVARETRPYHRQILALFLLSALGSALVLLVPVPLKIAVDSVLGSRPVAGPFEAILPSGSDSALLISTALLFVLITVLMQAQEVGLLLLSANTGQKLRVAVRDRLFDHVQRLSLNYHDTRGTLDSSYRIQWDGPAFQYIAVDGVVPLFTAALMVIGMIVVTLSIDWLLGAVALLITPIMVALFRVYGGRLRRQWHAAKKVESSAFSVVHEALSALRVVKAFGREEQESERFRGRSEASMQAEVRVALTEALLTMTVGLTIGLGTAVVLYVGVRRVQAGGLTLGQLLLVMTYLTQLYEPLRTIAKKVGDLQDSVASAERLFDVLDEEPDLVERAGAHQLQRARGVIRFDHVSFAYEDGPTVLHGISLDVPAGASVGIAGTTGAGKSTLISLLTRLYDPSSGAVLLDGVDLRDYRLEDLRRQFAIVLQEPVLFSTSIAENIGYGRLGASNDDIAAAARAANAHDFILRLPEGYRTVVGERGMKLSGGERQRIALARAFLKDAPILILDEPTSSVDVHTERGITEAIERLMSGRTTFMIAHRLTTLNGCDTRLVLESGRLVEERFDGRVVLRSLLERAAIAL
jgi:ATP-binding cassette, subfamily B, bacterial